MEPSYERNSRLGSPTGSPLAIRVLVVDGAIIALHGVRALLATHRRVVVVATAGTEREAVIALQTCRPDVVVLDVHVGPVSGIGFAKTIRESYPNIKIVFFSTYDDTFLLHAAIQAGAHGYLIKTASGEALAKSIEAAYAGQAMIDERLTKEVIQWVRSGIRTAPHATVDSCPDDDLRLLSHVAAGKTNKEIAQALNVAPRIVATRLQRIYKRLRISRRAEAVSCFLKYECEPHSGNQRTGRHHAFMGGQSAPNYPVMHPAASRIGYRSRSIAVQQEKPLEKPIKAWVKVPLSG
jgi:DNA-binding NarL/FixJ family response regulator